MKQVEANSDWKDLVLIGLEYALGRHTYITTEVAEYIKDNAETFFDERTSLVATRLLEEYFARADAELEMMDGRIDFEVWNRLYNFMRDNFYLRPAQ